MKNDKPKSELIKIAIISDLHVDYGYTPGMSNDCGKPICCRHDSGLPTKPSQIAKKWGDFNCDLAPWTLDSMMSFIKDSAQPDILLWGGDSIPHTLWL